MWQTVVKGCAGRAPHDAPPAAAQPPADAPNATATARGAGEVTRERLAEEIHRVNPRTGDVVLHPKARLHLGQWGMTPLRRLGYFALKVGCVGMLAHAYYTQRTWMTKGGNFVKPGFIHYEVDDKLAAWYFHCIGKPPGFVMPLQYHMQLPPDMEIDDDEVLTRLARHFMTSWPRAWERWSRGAAEPIDNFTDEHVQECKFLPPEGFDNKTFLTADDKPVIPPPDAKDAKDAPQPYPGDVIGGYFVQRRFGQTNHEVRRQRGGTNANEIGARSMVLAPDPWEERCYVLSFTHGKGYGVARLTYAVSPTSEFYPEPRSVIGAAKRFFMQYKAKYMLTAMASAVESELRSEQEKQAGKKASVSRHIVD